MTEAIPRCEIIPLPDHQVSFQVDGQERTRWHFGAGYPRPFLYPFNGPSGSTLTRMGHPGAANHGHHRSVWLAHQKVLGIDFWSDNTEARIRQKHWLCYRDGEDEAVMAVLLGWYDGHDPRELLQQELIVAVRPADGGETFVELQATFRPEAELLEFGQTNFGFLAVRLAKSISAHFGRGQITDSEGRIGEPAIFGKAARWMDYSGPVPASNSGPRLEVDEGVTYFDHPENPGYPSHWHVREDGWMGASVSRRQAVVTRQKEPLVLRYLLHAHGGPLDRRRAEEIARAFAERPAYELQPSSAKHQQYEVVR